MTVNRRTFLAGLAGVASSTATFAQNELKFPTQNIKVIVPYPAGGPYDGIARVVGQFLTEKYGWQLTVENRAGASGITGILAAKQSPPDGHTVVVTTSSTHGSAPALNKDLRYDPFKDLDPIILLAEAPMALLVRKEMPVKSVAELIDLLRKNPGKYNYASGGYASQHHLAMSMMFLQAELPQNVAAHVPFQGLAPAVNALVAGDVQFMFTTTGAAAAFIESGALRPLAVSSLQRSPRLPKLPTMAESGFPGFQIVPWCGLAAPAGTPMAILDIWNRSVNEALRDKVTQQRITNQDYDVRGGTAAAYTEFFTNDIRQYIRLAQTAGLTAN